MCPPRLIGLCGRMGSGKDTTAELLAPYGYKRLAFADPLKQEVADCIQDERFPEDIPLDLFEVMLTSRPRDAWKKPTPDGMRKLLQWYGTDFRRNQDSEYWIKKAESSIRDGKYVFSDVRFPNEASLIRKHGGQIWRIVRDVEDNGIPGHVSELIDGIEYDRKILNTGPLESLEMKLAGIMQMYQVLRCA